ncbi:unnamed protein product [Closterium sp. Naga37s-1]|nr:unnamed protein product [Closterium sp. Naga37s-1]
MDVSHFSFFERSTAKEFILFACRTISRSAPYNQRQTPPSYHRLLSLSSCTTRGESEEDGGAAGNASVIPHMRRSLSLPLPSPFRSHPPILHPPPFLPRCRVRGARGGSDWPGCCSSGASSRPGYCPSLGLSSLPCSNSPTTPPLPSFPHPPILPPSSHPSPILSSSHPPILSPSSHPPILPSSHPPILPSSHPPILPSFSRSPILPSFPHPPVLPSSRPPILPSSHHPILPSSRVHPSSPNVSPLSRVRGVCAEPERAAGARGDRAPGPHCLSSHPPIPPSSPISSRCAEYVVYVLNQSGLVVAEQARLTAKHPSCSNNPLFSHPPPTPRCRVRGIRGEPERARGACGTGWLPVLMVRCLSSLPLPILPGAEYVVYVVNQSGLVVLVVADEAYPRGSGFAVCKKVAEEYMGAEGDAWMSIQQDYKKSVPLLDKLLVQAQDPANVDKIAKVQSEIDETKRAVVSAVPGSGGGAGS